MGTWRTYWTKCRIVTSVSSWDMISVTKRWSLPARMRSTPEYTHAHPSWTKKGRASFNDCKYTEKLTRFFVNCMNSSGSVQDTCFLRMFHTTLPRRNVDVHCNVSYPTQKDPCCSATTSMMTKTFHSCSWPDFTTPWDIKVRATNWSLKTCQVTVQHVYSETVCSSKQIAQRVPPTSRTCLHCNTRSWPAHRRTSPGIRALTLRLRATVRDLRIKVTENSTSTLYQALCLRVVSMQCVTCCVVRIDCLPNETVSEEKVLRSMTQTRTDWCFFILSVRVFSRLRYSTEYTRYLCTRVLGLFIRAYLGLCP